MSISTSFQILPASLYQIKMLKVETTFKTTTIMKKLLLVFMCLFTLQSVVRADNDKPIQVNQLPQQAQQFIKQHFADSSVAMAKVESDWWDKSYDIIFTNGNKVEFDKKGDWKDVDCRYSSVPAAIVPAAILKQVIATYPGVKILKIDRDKKEYEVKLSNKWELKFDRQFNLIDMDD